MNYHYILSIFSISAALSAQTTWQPFLSNDIQTIYIDKIIIDVGITSVTYQLNNSNIFIQPRPQGTSLRSLIPTPSTIHDLSANNQILFNPIDKLFPVVRLTVDNKLQSIMLKSTLSLNETLSQNFQAIFYINVLLGFLHNNNNFSIITTAGNKSSITYQKQPVSLALNMTIDFSGGHFSALDIYIPINQNPVFSLDAKTLKDNGIVLEIY